MLTAKSIDNIFETGLRVTSVFVKEYDTSEIAVGDVVEMEDRLKAVVLDIGNNYGKMVYYTLDERGNCEQCSARDIRRVINHTQYVSEITDRLKRW